MAYKNPQQEALHHVNEARAIALSEQIKAQISQHEAELVRLRNRLKNLHEMRKHAHAHRRAQL